MPLSHRFVVSLALAWPTAALAAYIPDPQIQDNPMLLENQEKTAQDLISALENMIYKIKRIDSGLTFFEQDVNKPDRDHAKTDLPTKKTYNDELDARNKLGRAYTALQQQVIPALLQARRLIEEALRNGGEAYQQIRPQAEINYPQVAQALKASVDSMRANPPVKGTSTGADPNPFQNQVGKIQQMQDPIQQIGNFVSQAEGTLHTLDSMKDDIQSQAQAIHDYLKQNMEKLARSKKFEAGIQSTQNSSEGPSPQKTLEEIENALKALQSSLEYVHKLTNLKDPKAMPTAKDRLEKFQKNLTDANIQTQTASELLPGTKREVDRSNQGLEQLGPLYQAAPDQPTRDQIAAQAQALIDQAKTAQTRVDPDQAGSPIPTARDKSRDAGQLLQEVSGLMYTIDKIFGDNPDRAQNLLQVSERPHNLADVVITTIQDKSQTTYSGNGPPAKDQFRDAVGVHWDGR